jgi:ABC-2 type transport system permease protein
MRPIVYLLQKEFLQIFRNRAMLPIIFVMPIIQLIVLAHATTFEVRSTPYVVVDSDASPTSRRLVQRLDAGGYFRNIGIRTSAALADADLQRGDATLIVHIPPNFERSLANDRRASIRLVIDAQDGARAGVIQAYASRILADFAVDVHIETARAPVTPAGLRIIPAYWYNPDLNYQTLMVPGILVLLVTMIGTFLSAMNVVREKELGTIEQLNVTPIRKLHFITGKLLPFWIIAMFELAFGLVIAWIVFRIPVEGSLALVFAMASVYLLVVLGIGLAISTITETQQQAMFVAWFVMVIFILMSGLFTPIESMPAWAQKITLLNPVAYFIEIMRRVMLKGAGFAEIQFQFTALAVYAVAILTLAVRQYRKTTA